MHKINLKLWERIRNQFSTITTLSPEEINKWITHLKERFSKKELQEWCTYSTFCPCTANFMECKDCKHKNRFLYLYMRHYGFDIGCKKALEWMKLSDRIKMIIKEKINL